MNAQALVATITAIVLLLGVIGSVLGLTYRIGVLSGKVSSFMITSERDRAEILKDIGRIEQRYDAHVDQHHGGKS